MDCYGGLGWRGEEAVESGTEIGAERLEFPDGSLESLVAAAEFETERVTRVWEGGFQLRG